MNKIPVNIFKWVPDEGFIPSYTSSHNYKEDYKKESNLIVISSGKKSHYLACKDINSVLKESNHHKKVLCYKCMLQFSSSHIKAHLLDCLQNKFQKIRMPSEKDPDIQFSKIEAQQRCSFVVYADFECLVSKQNNVQIDANEAFTSGESVASKTEITHNHIPCGFCYVVINEEGKIFRRGIPYRGKDCVGKFLKTMRNLATEIMTIYGIEIPMTISIEQEKQFAESKECYLCGQVYSKSDIRVRDHSHVTGKYRGSCHRNCNLNLKVKKVLPIIIHNLKKYDNHIIIQGFNQIPEEIQIIPINSEQYISIQFGAIKFLDSLQFLNASLSNLVSNLLGSSKNNFKILTEVFGEDSKKVTRKGVYPYEWVDSFKKFEFKGIPPREVFYSQLRNENISEDDYNYALEIYNHFNMTNFGDYHDLYLLTDCLLLACVFENFRDMSMNFFQLDPAYFYSAPGLAFEAALLKTRVTLEKIRDHEIYLFLEKLLRGGTSLISKRFASAKNHYIYN